MRSNTWANGSSPAPGFDYGAERHGRIPGALHLLFRRMFNDDNNMADDPNSSRRPSARSGQQDRTKPMRSLPIAVLSHRASSLWFTATQILGWDHLRVYDGSWTE